MPELLRPLLMLLVGVLVTPYAIAAIRKGELRTRGGVLIKKEERAFVFWTCAGVQAFVALFLLIGGAIGLFVTIRVLLDK